MVRDRWRPIGAVGTLLCFSLLAAQTPQPVTPALVESGQVAVDGHSTPYRIRRLPLNAFPELPAEVAEVLNQKQCLIPQTYEAHRPENVVHASLEHAGSSDWAVLCSAQGAVSLLVFFGSAPGVPTVLATAEETKRLQPHDTTGVLGFNWGIDPASPAAVHEAQSGMEKRPPRLDHDALADSVVDGRTIYRVYLGHRWTVAATAD